MSRGVRAKGWVAWGEVRRAKSDEPTAGGDASKPTMRGIAALLCGQANPAMRSVVPSALASVRLCSNGPPEHCFGNDAGPVTPSLLGLTRGALRVGNNEYV